MTREESVALYFQGRESWNKWAAALLEERAKLEQSGEWVSVRKEGFVWTAPKEEGLNEDTQDWLMRARADFRAHIFDKDADFRRYIFPSDAVFGLDKSDDEAAIEPAYFESRALFQGARFYGGARFFSTKFEKEALFWNVDFSLSAGFSGSEFNADAIFREAKFFQKASFRNCIFLKNARFNEAEFHHIAWFDDSTFQEEASFTQTSFRNFTALRNVKFSKNARFAGAEIMRGFELTGANFVKEIPDFIQAKFAEAPVLDQIQVRHPSFLNKSGKYDAVRYRALKRLAIQGHDNEREQLFFKGELRSRRLSEDKIWHLRFWFSILYDIFSDFGKSAVRPLIFWFASVCLFAYYYTMYFGTTCGVRVSDGLFISLMNALPVIGGSRKTWFADCLSGTTSNNPDNVAFGFLQLGQTVVSTVFLFLFLLGLRNWFKIK